MEAVRELRIGLRFRRRQAPALRILAHRVRSAEIPNQHAGLFQGAADAAEKGEPLVIRCTQPVEAVLIAQGFANFGLRPPTIEDLNGPGDHPRR